MSIAFAHSIIHHRTMSTPSSLSHTINTTIFDDDDYDSDEEEEPDYDSDEEEEPTLTPEELAEVEEWNRRVEEASRRDAAMFEFYRAQVMTPEELAEVEEWNRCAEEASRLEAAMFELYLKEKEYAPRVQTCLMLARVYIKNLEEHSSEC